MNKTTNMTRSSLCGLVCLSLLERRVDLPAGFPPIAAMAM